jgi:hypothetical protein
MERTIESYQAPEDMRNYVSKLESLLYDAILELAYVQEYQSGWPRELIASAKGKEIVDTGIVVLKLKDLSGDTWARANHGTATPHWSTCPSAKDFKSSPAPTSKITTATLNILGAHDQRLLRWLKEQAKNCHCIVCKKITGRN